MVVIRRVLPVLGCLCAAALVVGLGSGSSASPRPSPPTQADAEGVDDLRAEGRRLYGTGCVSCHGVDGRGQDAPNGSQRGPTLERTGAAGVYYQVSTGRMPLANPGDVPSRKDPAYSEGEIEALVAYVASLGDGPEVPEVDLAEGDLARGGELYRETCQACHSATGAGGALSYGRAAPSLSEPNPTQVAAAIRSGPGPMPAFGPELLDQRELDSVARYVDYLKEPDDRGGFALGRLGPIPEGFMVWVGALGLLLVVAFWMGARRSAQERVDPEPPDDGSTRADASSEFVAASSPSAEEGR